MGVYLWVRKIPWKRTRQPAPVFLPGKSHGQRSLAGYSPGDCKEPDIMDEACVWGMFPLLLLLSRFSRV